jgi:hypothetical protein
MPAARPPATGSSVWFVRQATRRTASAGAGATAASSSSAPMKLPVRRSERFARRASWRTSCADRVPRPAVQQPAGGVPDQEAHRGRRQGPDRRADQQGAGEVPRRRGPTICFMTQRSCAASCRARARRPIRPARRRPWPTHPRRRWADDPDQGHRGDQQHRVAHAVDERATKGRQPRGLDRDRTASDDGRRTRKDNDHAPDLAHHDRRDRPDRRDGMANTHNLRDAALKLTRALPNGAATVTAATSIDTGRRRTSGLAGRGQSSTCSRRRR